LGQYVKLVRSKGRLYFYLIEVSTVGEEREEKVVRSKTEDETRQLGWEPCKSEESETPQVTSGPVYTVVSPQETRTEANGGVEGYSVVRRQEGRYVLEPLKLDLKKGYVIVTAEERVFCGPCPGFTCSHVEFMHNWLRTHRRNSE